MDEWRELVTVSVLVDPDGSPTELRTLACLISPVFPQIELELLREAETAVGVWLVWEDRWTKDGEYWTRPVDLTANQPSHRLVWTDDEGREDVRLLLVDASEGGTAVAWEKHEWYSKGWENGGVWSRTPGGWRHRNLFTPGAARGVLCVEELGPDRPMSKRRNR